MGRKRLFVGPVINSNRPFEEQNSFSEWILDYHCSKDSVLWIFTRELLMYWIILARHSMSKINFQQDVYKKINDMTEVEFLLQ